MKTIAELEAEIAKQVALVDELRDDVGMAQADVNDKQRDLDRAVLDREVCERIYENQFIVLRDMKKHLASEMARGASELKGEA